MKTYKNIDEFDKRQGLITKDVEELTYVVREIIDEYQAGKWHPLNLTTILIEDDLDVIRLKRSTGINVLKADNCIMAADLNDHYMLLFLERLVDVYCVLLPFEIAKFRETEKIRILAMCSEEDIEEKEA